MEKIIDFDTWAANYQPPEIKYVAVFDPMSGAVQSVGPDHAFVDLENKIYIDVETAESIITGEIKISSCVIDLTANTLEISEIKSIVRIDDVLHRIIDRPYSTVANNDLFITYYKGQSLLTIQLSEVYGGTKKLPEQDQPIKQKRIIWDGDTQMDFLVTEYNDPNVIFDLFSVKINDLKNQTFQIENFNYNNFSIYTRRLFTNCIMETV